MRLTQTMDERPQGSAIPLVVLTALAGATLTIVLGGALSLKLIVAGLGAVGLFVGAFVSGYPREVFLGAWAFALTYNRQYFVFEGLLGHYGSHGPYLIVADGFLLVLLLLWVYDWGSVGIPRPKGTAIWIWLAPFMVACAISALLANHSDWSFFEMIRLVRIGIVLAYFRYQVTPRGWWAAIIGLGAALTTQSLLGTAEVITGHSGILGILGMGSLEDLGPVELRQESFYGWRRATATMSHPPNLACYMMMTIPMLVALGFTAKRQWLRAACFAGAFAGLVGLCCTLSRWPLGVMVGQLFLVVVGLAATRMIRVQTALGVVAVAVCSVILAAVPFTDKIADRLTRDFDRSVDFRVRENATGLRIAEENPFFGVGPNNYVEDLIKYNPEWEWALKYEDISIKQLHIRPIASPHNGFLLIAAEDGVIGFVAFSWLFVGVGVMAFRAIRDTNGAMRAACIGLSIGIIGLILQQIVDFSIWADPLLYTFALFGGILNIAPAIFAQEADPEAAA